MEYSLKKVTKKSFFLLKNNILTDMNKEFIDLTGFTIEELLGKSIEEIGSMLRINSQEMFENNPQNWISYIFTKTSEVKEVSISCRGENCENENIYYFKVKRNSPFKERFQYLDYLLKDNKIGVAICSIPDLVLLKSNQKFLRSQKFINDSVEDNIGKQLKNSVNRFEGSKIEAIFKEIIRTGKVYYDEECKCDSMQMGITYWDSTIIPIFINGKAKYLIETVLDVTERVLNRNVIGKQSKEIQKQNEFIEKQEKQMSSIIEGLGEEILIVDKSGTYVGISDLINNRITGIGKNHKEIYKEMEFYDLEGNIIPLEETCTSKALMGEKVKNSRTKIVCDGKTRYIDNTSIPIFNKKDELQFVINITHDITAEIKSNILLEKTLKSQEEFLANISHELKTPLNVIYSTLQLFNIHCKNGSLDEKKESIYKYTNSMMQNCYRLSKLINNIVDLSKIEAGFFELTLSNNNIVGIVEEMVMSVIGYTDIKGLSIVFDTYTEEKIIACDPEKIERIVLNLISNAIKFSDVGNKISVNIKEKNKLIEISVEDNGIGIERDELDSIFNRFKQVDKSLSRNAEGTGIGLSLVKALVEMHKGRIYVESEAGKGSKFIVELPNQILMDENILYDGKIHNKTENLQVEFSDIYLDDN